MINIWKDTTSYSMGQRGKKEPTSYTTESGELRITVTCGHIDWCGEWIMNCYTLGMSQVELIKCESVEEAKLRAIVLVKNRLSYLVKIVSSLTV